MRGGATEVNETHKGATSKKRLRTTGVNDTWKVLVGHNDVLY
jgi:hypothetical protein